MLRRELKVAFSTNHQPIWARVLKWAVIIAIVIWLHNARYFWPGVACVVVACLTVHFFYRFMTHGWTRAWGGWHDVKTASAASENNQ